MYIVEGNIGVGKSTFLAMLQTEFPELTIVQEPVDSWSVYHEGQSLLENFYTNPQRWAYTFETMTMFKRVRYHLSHQNDHNPFRVMERSIYSGHYCFAQNDYAQGFFSPVEWESYQQWADYLVNKSCKAPRGFIYLRAQPQTCYDRLRVRDRKGEETISLDYLKQLHQWHDMFLINKKNLPDTLKNIPVLVLDTDIDFVTNAAVRQQHKERVQAFINTIQSAE
jgi:deoxyadenosine/deoxycytidine kinase